MGILIRSGYMALFASSFALISGDAWATTKIRFVSMQSMEAPKNVLTDLVEKFNASQKDVTVEFETVDHEAFKASVEEYLRPGDKLADVITWQAGNRARVLARKGQLLPLNDLIPNLEEFGEGVKASVTFNNGKVYGVPYSYYHWTMYYNKDVLSEAGVKNPPVTWAEFTKSIEMVKKVKKIPISLGTAEPWTVGGWFDFLGMHSYGFDFHMNLLGGDESYVDKKVVKAMNQWVELANLKAFPENHKSMKWQDQSKLLVDGKAAFMLMGNFWVGEMKVPLHGSNIGSFAFPKEDAKAPSFGVAPTDIICGVAKSKNKAAVGKFLAYVASAQVQENTAKALGTLPPNSKATVAAEDTFSLFGQDLLNKAKAISQFYDRDADPAVATRGMEMLVELIDHPNQLNDSLEKIEKTRKRIHRKK